MKKRTLFITVALLTFFCAFKSKAQIFGNNERYSSYVSHVNVGVNGYFNMNPGQKTYNPGFGVDLKYQYDVTANLGVTAGVGYSVVTINSKTAYSATKSDLKFLPIRLGAKAYFLPEFYLGGELGVTYLKPGLGSNTESKLGKFFAPQVGYETNHLDFSFRYENTSHQQEYVSFLVLRAAYIFNF